jgi:hypothetical protein
MQSQSPTPGYVWGLLSLRFEIELTRHKLEISRLCGLSEEFGPAHDNLNFEENRLIDELSGILIQAIAFEAQQMANGTGKRVGRPHDVMMPYLAPELLSIYLRCNNSGGGSRWRLRSMANPGKKKPDHCWSSSRPQSSL